MSSIKTKMTKKDLESIVYTFLSEGNYRACAKILWPWYEQNDWSEKIWNAIEKYDRLCIMGHGSASKTFTASIWFLLDWLAHANDTALILTSATMPSMNARIWADFKTLWSKARIDLSKIAQVVDSKHIIRKGILDAKEAIHAIAAESDDSQAKVQGLHAKRNRLIIDEADNPYSNSIWNAVTNLMTSGHFKGIALANPDDKNSEFGMHTEPVNGWDSINPEVDYEWESKLGWHVLRLDGLQSPNILAGVDKHPFLLTNLAVNDTRDNKGTNSRSWWTYIRAFYPPDNVISTIFTSSIIEKCRVPVVWYTTKTAIAACDPAFEGGDDCILVFGFMGRMAHNPQRTAVEANEYIKIKRKDMSKEVTFDFGDQIIELCKSRGVAPEHFALDASGNAKGLSDYIKTKWAKTVMSITFGGSASERKLTSEDTGPARERYKNFVTELWYVSREWCRLGLVYFKDLPRDAKIQLEGRRYTLKGKDAKSGRELIMAEPKSEMKSRGLTSPDYADAICLLIHLVRHFALGFIPGTVKDYTPTQSKSFVKRKNVWTMNYGVEDRNSH
jgi:hypothetical protein